MPLPTYARFPQTPQLPVGNPTQCPPPCPACGGLECLCRPRFFPGQVLTDDDLNRLENHVIAKNRLHNRYFHGSGVVCGLEVVCDPCKSDLVTVKPGYALAPCGDDIVVCNDASVPICDLINQCKPRMDNCGPYAFVQPQDCQQGVQRWVLSICYAEKPSRGVQPMMSQPCNCKGACTGGCSCNGRSVATPTSMSASASKYNPQCEPTLICEGFSFTATRYIDPAAQQRLDLTNGVWGFLAGKAQQFGPLLTRLLACYLKAKEIHDPNAQPMFNDDTQAMLAYSEYAAALRDFAAENVAHHCDLAKKLDSLDLSAPPANPPGASASVTVRWQPRFTELNLLWLEVLRDCISSALLPPCPDVTGANCVPLAVVTINADSCNVIDICNWKVREFALTLPSLYYWSSFVNWSSLKDFCATLCCEPPNVAIGQGFVELLNGVVANNSSITGTPALVHASAGTTNTPALVGGGTSLTGGTVSAGGANDGKPPPSNPPTGTLTAMLQAVSGFIGQATMPDGLARLLSVAQPPLARASQEVANLHSAMAELQSTVKEQGALIKQLMSPD
jgi:hypothetical protein